VEDLGHDTHILVVEDDADSRAALCDAMIDAGYLPFAVADGVEALEHLRTGARPNLIVLDLMLPRIDGWRFLSILADEPDLQGIPVLVCTGAVDPRPPGVPRGPRPHQAHQAGRADGVRHPLLRPRRHLERSRSSQAHQQQQAPPSTRSGVGPHPGRPGKDGVSVTDW
jgi:CheY-like chemotaxis protein